MPKMEVPQFRSLSRYEVGSLVKNVELVRYDMDRLGTWCKWVRGLMGLTVRDLGELLDIPYPKLAEVETGQRLLSPEATTRLIEWLQANQPTTEET